MYHFLVFSFVLLTLFNHRVLSQEIDKELYRRGTDYYYEGNLNQALALIDSAIVMNDEDLSRILFRSKVRAKLGQYQLAIEDLTTCIDRSKNDGLYLNLRSDYYVRAGNLTAALSDINQSLKLKDTWFGHYRRGLIYVKQNRLDDALNEFNTSIKLDEFQADPLKARANLKYQIDDKVGACDDMYTVFDMGFEEVREWIISKCR